MRRAFILAALAALFLAGQGHARLIKEMQVTRSGKVETAAMDQTTVYRLVLPSNKVIVIGDRAFFRPATQAALDQAAQRRLPVEVTGQLLIFNDQLPVFTLPLAKIDVKGLETGNQPQAAASAEAPGGQAQPSGDVQPFKDARLKASAAPLGKALDDYAFFSSRAWRLLEPGKAEFRGEIDLGAYTARDSRYMSHLRSQDLRETFKSIAFVADFSLRPNGSVECTGTALEAEFQDGQKDRVVWKDAAFFFDRIDHNHKIKIDSILAKAAQNPSYGKGAAPAGQ